jgi:hypothetical protein
MNIQVTFEHSNVLNINKTQRNDVNLITYPHQLSIKFFLKQTPLLISFVVGFFINIWPFSKKNLENLTLDIIN